MQQNLLLHLRLMGANFKSKEPDGELLLEMKDTRLHNAQLAEVHHKMPQGNRYCTSIMISRSYLTSVKYSFWIRGNEKEGKLLLTAKA
jgi:5-enolpyruvylshikimate-3-phosphate synthase